MVEVFPSKIDYEGDYHEILRDVDDSVRAIAFEYLRATFSYGEVDDINGTRLEWLILLRNEMERLERAVAFVAARPHRALEHVASTGPTDRVRRPDPTTRRAVLRGLGRGEVMDVPGLGKVRRAIPTRLTHETLDTAEHRWLRAQLQGVAGALSQILAEISRERGSLASLGRPGVRLRAEEAEIGNLLRTTSRMLEAPPLSEAGDDRWNSTPSLTLLQAPGYREAYQALMVLRLGLSLRSGALAFSVKELDVLYEIWCFVRVARVLAGAIGTGQMAGNFFEFEPHGIRVRLRGGQASEITFSSGARTFTLRYHPSYAALTGEQRPDIVLEIQEQGWPPIVIVLDAKYRLQSDDAYVRAYGASGPPIDAVNALHRYRDAIVLDWEGRGPGRPTVKGIALFPGEWNPEFEESRLYASLSEVGIGALPLLPSNSELAERWLGEVIASHAADLASPGPPFLAWEHYRGVRATDRPEPDSDLGL